MLVESETETKSGGWSSAFTYEYNTDGTIAARHESAIHIGSRLSGDPFYEETITYEYGSGGHVIKDTRVQTYADGFPGSNYTEEYTYDGNGQLAKSTTDSGNKYQYTCDWIYAPNADGPYIFPYSGADHP